MIAKALLTFSCLFLLCFLNLTAEIQWASYVISYSSQLGLKQYSAEQALGEPNVMPNFGFTPCAWAPKYIKSKDGEFLHLGFNRPIPVRTIIINL
ncbi:MAG: OmpA family protein, partial [Candidatus Kapaibacteriota bacterium]